jgi:hypothetical protein
MTAKVLLERTLTRDSGYGALKSPKLLDRYLGQATFSSEATADPMTACELDHEANLWYPFAKSKKKTEIY